MAKKPQPRPKPIFARKYPRASAFILGVYSLNYDALHVLAAKPEMEGLFAALETVISGFHKNWKLDEIYWKGYDYQEALIDCVAGLGLNEADDYTKEVISELLHLIKAKTGFHQRVVHLTHLIGKAGVKKEQHHGDEN